MYNIYFLVFEFGAIFSFLFILSQEYKNAKLRETLLLAFIFGMILESINAPVSQSYYYSKDFLFALLGTPVAIGAGWAIVYYVTQKIARKYSDLRWYQEPFLMALMAMVFDLVLDPIAIRLGFWTWRISLDQEFFGVTYDNFVGWMAAIWTFSLLINLSDQGLLKEKISKIVKYIAVIISPILLSFQITIYVIFSAFFSGKFTFHEIIGFYLKGDFSYAYQSGVQEWKLYFFIMIILFLVIYLIKNIYSRKNVIH